MTKRKKIFSYILLIAMIGLTFGILIGNYELGDVLDVLSEANYGWVALGFGCMLVYAVCEGESMRLILRVLGVKFSTWRAYLYANIDLYFCAVTPSSTGGAPLMMYYMAQDGIPYSKSGVMVLLNMMMYALAIVIWTVVSLIVCPFILAEENLFFRICLAIGVISSAVLITLCMMGICRPSLIEKLGQWGIRVGKKWHLIKDAERWEGKLSTFCTECTECSEILRHHPIVSLWALLLNLGQRAAFFAVSYMAYRALGFEGEVFVPLFAIQSVITLAGYSIPSPGSVGASEAMFLILYEQIYAEDERVAAMVLTRGINYYANVLLCAITTLIYHIRVTRRQRLASLPTEER